ncbi:hypothetical protein L207DRAFT_508024 [Hyaloscypha variabilis F]|uniref:Uncharacterized protein n=1 Tax=Hyaloscypha variabilis (strain UAMH 11265 / GT02V1 / F) TaxID=1149755 RepID=A0A2J6S2Z7_HYAVF|nr:hypothetical protein L207DRAFT_508024 [Hyaloscypha variabilis F]
MTCPASTPSSCSAFNQRRHLQQSPTPRRSRLLHRSRLLRLQSKQRLPNLLPHREPLRNRAHLNKRNTTRNCALIHRSKRQQPRSSHLQRPRLRPSRVHGRPSQYPLHHRELRRNWLPLTSPPFPSPFPKTQLTNPATPITSLALSYVFIPDYLFLFYTKTHSALSQFTAYNASQSSFPATISSHQTCRTMAGWTNTPESSDAWVKGMGPGLVAWS